MRVKPYPKECDSLLEEELLYDGTKTGGEEMEIGCH